MTDRRIGVDNHTTRPAEQLAANLERAEHFAGSPVPMNPRRWQVLNFAVAGAVLFVIAFAVFAAVSVIGAAS